VKLQRRKKKKKKIQHLVETGGIDIIFIYLFLNQSKISLILNVQICSKRACFHTSVSGHQKQSRQHRPPECS
jgi:hypothetical protein